MNNFRFAGSIFSASIGSSRSVLHKLGAPSIGASLLAVFFSLAPASAQVIFGGDAGDTENTICSYNGKIGTVINDDCSDADASFVEAPGIYVGPDGSQVRLDAATGSATFGGNNTFGGFATFNGGAEFNTSVGFSGIVNMRGNRIIGLGDPTSAAEAATKGYVDGVVGAASTKNMEQDGRLDSVEAKNTQQDGRLTNVESKNTEQDGRLTGVEVKNTEQDGRLAGVEAKNTEQDGRIFGTELKNEEQDGRLASVEGKNTEQDGRISATETKNTQQDDRITATETKNVQQDNRLFSVESKNTQQDGRLDGHDMMISSLDGRVGTLEGGLSSLSKTVDENQTEARQGIAAAIAMTTAPMPSAPGRTSWAGNYGYFKGESAFGGSLAHRLNFDEPVALTAGYGYGGGSSHGFRVGLAGEF